jgi:membrane associated rhomboid family serine protease
MFPLRDDNPQINQPIATYAIIGLNLLSWIVLQGFGSTDGLNASICQYGLIPSDLFSNPIAMRTCPSSQGWLGVVSSMFMHGGWMHLLGNMWFLWVFGGNIEDSMGPLRFALFYFLCGLCAAAAQVASDIGSGVPMVGASGAIGGVMGAYILLFPKVKVHIFVFILIFKVPAAAMLGYWAFIQLIGGFGSSGSGGGVAFWAHIGGFAAGLALTPIFKDQELLLNHPYHGWKEAQDVANIWDNSSNQQE